MAIRSWFDIRGLPVSIPREGRSLGKVEDFYCKMGTSNIYALRVKVGVLGYRVLSTSAISSIANDDVTVSSDSMLIDEANSGPLQYLSTGSSLLSCEVKSESGATLGKVSDMQLATDPPIVLRIAAFQLDNGKTFSASEITSFDNNIIYILNK